jgi:phosphoribosylformimino-5-aminoimidazole carboxamide ribotide isomerase
LCDAVIHELCHCIVVAGASDCYFLDKMEIIPSIDLRDGKVVRLKQGDYQRQVNYAVDPFETAQSFQRAGATWMHIVDLDGAKEGRPMQSDLIARLIAATNLKVETGGGIRTADDIRRLIDSGASRVVVGTQAIEHWDWFTTLAHDPAYADKLVLALDAKEGMVATRGWTQTTGWAAVDVAKEVSDWPLAAILYTDVAKDGLLAGPNIEHTARLASAGRVKVIASGGVGNIGHIHQLLPIGVWGAIVGRSLYEGTLDLAEAIRVGKSNVKPA